MKASTPDQFSLSTNAALQYISEVESPRSLQHRARNAIITSMSNNSLRAVPTLQIPKHLISYILMEID